MKRLSDNARDIGDSWAIGRGRYLGAGPMNQRFLSTTGDGERSIAMPRALGRQQGGRLRMTKSEAQTRSELIDHQLAQAGWNVKDPTQVVADLDAAAARQSAGLACRSNGAAPMGLWRRQGPSWTSGTTRSRKQSAWK